MTAELPERAPASDGTRQAWVNSRCSWCRKGGTSPTRLAWVALNDDWQWVCERCADALEGTQ